MDLTAYQAAVDGAVFRDMSHFGRFVVRGADAAALLHHLTTQDIKGLTVGTACDTVLISARGRMLDLVTIIRQERNLFMVITSPNRREMFLPHCRHFILFRQDIQLEDGTGQAPLFGTFGKAIAPDSSPEEGAHFTSRLPGGGWLTQSRPELPELRDPATFNVLRVEAAMPVTGLEISEDHNPWEAELDAMISLHKGCYNGQEIIARLNTYQKVKQRLRVLQSQTPLPEVRTVLKAAGKEAGILTSSAVSPRFGPLGLAYLRSGHQDVGATVNVDGGGQEATVRDVPWHAG